MASSKSHLCFSRVNSDCNVDGTNVGNGTSQGSCPSGLLCYADGSCRGKLLLEKCKSKWSRLFIKICMNSLL